MTVNELIKLIERIKITEENKQEIANIKELIESQKYADAVRALSKLKEKGKVKFISSPFVEKKEEKIFEV